MMQNKYSLVKVNTRSKNWSLYLKILIEYLFESWPKDFSHLSAFQIKIAFKKDLNKKLKSDDRFLFLFKLNRNIVGLTNVYYEKNRLNIAEFYILPKFRKLKLGSIFFGLIAKKAKEEGIKIVNIEVDPDLKMANAFWKSFGFKLKKGKRNLYSGKL